jgi:hypothetical protein
VQPQLVQQPVNVGGDDEMLVHLANDLEGLGGRVEVDEVLEEGRGDAGGYLGGISVGCGRRGEKIERGGGTLGGEA